MEDCTLQAVGEHLTYFSAEQFSCSVLFPVVPDLGGTACLEDS